MHNDNVDHGYHEDLEALEKAKGLRYEHRELDFNKVGKFINAFFMITIVFFVLAFVAMFVIQKLVVGRESTTPLVNVPSTLPEKAPLQNNVTTWKDMADLRMKENEATTKYSPNADKPGTYRVPVTRAMEKLAAQGPEGLQAR